MFLIPLKKKKVISHKLEKITLIVVVGCAVLLVACGIVGVVLGLRLTDRHG